MSANSPIRSAQKGVLEPLLVRFIPHEDTYYIISGERRYHASLAAGLHELPCIEKIADDAETLEIALIENLQRKDLDRLRRSRRPPAPRRSVRLHARRHRQENRPLALLRHRNDVPARDSGRSPPHLRRKRNHFEILAPAGRAPAHRKEDAGDRAPHRPGRSHARRSPQGPQGGNGIRAAPAALRLRLRIRRRRVSASACNSARATSAAKSSPPPCAQSCVAWNPARFRHQQRSSDPGWHRQSCLCSGRYSTPQIIRAAQTGKQDRRGAACCALDRTALRRLRARLLPKLCGAASMRRLPGQRIVNLIQKRIAVHKSPRKLLPRRENFLVLHLRESLVLIERLLHGSRRILQHLVVVA